MYGHSQFSKNGQGNSRQDEIGSRIYHKASRLLENRRKLLNPFPIKNAYMGIWKYGLTAKEWDAWETLQKHRGISQAIHRTEKIVLILEASSIYIPHDTELPDIHIRIDQLPERMQWLLHHWCLKHKALEKEEAIILRKIRELCCMCTTAGQLRRVWPALFGFMPDNAKDKQFGAKARSPYPADVLRLRKVDDHGRDLPVEVKEEWTPDQLAWMDDIFAESLVLPEGEFENYPQVRHR